MVADREAVTVVDSDLVAARDADTDGVDTLRDCVRLTVKVADVEGDEDGGHAGFNGG